MERRAAVYTLSVPERWVCKCGHEENVGEKPSNGPMKCGDGEDVWGEEKVGEHPGQIEGDDGPFCYNHPNGCEKVGGEKR
jgi:hypothetical protein